jgi:hypothetical protein
MRQVPAGQSFSKTVSDLATASGEGDPMLIAQNFGVDDLDLANVFTLSTSAPTLANTNRVLATLIAALQKGGVNRTT